MKGKWPIVTAWLVLAALSACSSEPRSVTLHEPGLYKGDSDELLAKPQQQQQALVDRFRTTQTDR